MRGFTQDDAHVFCLPDQVTDETLAILHLTEEIHIFIYIYIYTYIICIHIVYIQVTDEILAILNLTEEILSKFGFKDYEIFLSTRPDESIGDDNYWELATNGLIEALERKGWKYSINAGDGAFYGPKIDLKIKVSQSRTPLAAAIIYFYVYVHIYVCVYIYMYIYM